MGDALVAHLENECRNFSTVTSLSVKMGNAA